MALDRERRAPLHVQGDLDEIAQRIDEVLNVAFGLGENLAGVARFDPGEHRFVLLNLVGQAVQQYAPLIRRHLGPAGRAKRLGGSLHGAVHILRPHRRHLGERLAGSRITRGEGRAVGGGDPLSANERLEGRLGEKLRDELFVIFECCAHIRDGVSSEDSIYNCSDCGLGRPMMRAHFSRKAGLPKSSGFNTPLGRRPSDRSSMLWQAVRPMSRNISPVQLIE